jgi:uncharacterized protein YukJ
LIGKTVHTKKINIMPVNYGMLRGSVIDAIPYQGGADHYQVEVQGGANLFRIAVDVYSVIAGGKMQYSATGYDSLDTDREVMFFKDENFMHPVTTTMLNAPLGFTPKNNLDQKLWLDYIRYTPTLFPLSQMKVVPPKAAGGGTQDNLNQDIDPWIQKAKNNSDAEVFALGSGWDDNAPGARPDPRHYFNPDPSLGIHDIHMNQGDTGHEAVYNGIWQDGGLFLHFISANQWVAMFFRFQNQRTQTDNNGNPQ